jgi:primary-amine oxidase
MVLTDDYVSRIDTLHINKTNAIPYHEGDGPALPKYARAIILEGGKEVTASQEYMIGPLPVSGEKPPSRSTIITTMRALEAPSLPMGNTSILNVQLQQTPLIASVMTRGADITSALFQSAVNHGSSDERTNLFVYYLLVPQRHTTKHKPSTTLRFAALDQPPT